MKDVSLLHLNGKHGISAYFFRHDDKFFCAGFGDSYSDGIRNFICQLLALFVALFAKCLQKVIRIIPWVFFGIKDVVALNVSSGNFTDYAGKIIAFQYLKPFSLPAGISELFCVGHRF